MSLALKKKKKTADPAFGSALQIWVMARHYYGISALVPQTAIFWNELSNEWGVIEQSN